MEGPDKLRSPIFNLVSGIPPNWDVECGNDDNVRGLVASSKLCDLMKACVSGGRQNECGKWQQFQGPCQQVRNLTKDSKGEMLMIFLSERRCLCQVAQKDFSWKDRKPWHLCHFALKEKIG